MKGHPCPEPHAPSPDTMGREAEASRDVLCRLASPCNVQSCAHRAVGMALLQGIPRLQQGKASCRELGAGPHFVQPRMSQTMVMMSALNIPLT